MLLYSIFYKTFSIFSILELDCLDHCGGMNQDYMYIYGALKIGPSASGWAKYVM